MIKAVFIISAHLDLDEREYLELGATCILKKLFKNGASFNQVSEILSD